MNSTNNSCITLLEYGVEFSIEESRAIGIINVFLCSVCIIPYLIVLSTIVSNNSLYKIHAYRIMVHLGVMDLGELVMYFFVNALMMISNSSFDYWFNKVCNALSNAGFWLGSASMVFILAINRFIVMLNINFPYWLNENLFYKILLILAYGWSLFNSIIFILPNMGAIMIPNGFIYETGNSLFCVLDIANIQSIYILVVLGITCALYLIIVVYMIIQRQLVTSDSRIIVGREGQLLFQFMFVYIYKSVIATLWTWYPYSDAPLSFAIFLSFSLLEAGYAPYMYFFLNRTLRDYIIELVRKFFGMKVYTTNSNTMVKEAW